MRKLWKRVVICALLALAFRCGGLVADRQQLRREVVRLHVLANSDSGEDQSVKLQVKDAVVEYLQTALADIADAETAKRYIRENLPRLQMIANETLTALGVEPDAVVTFCREEFGKRIYDSFTLPAGIYDSLRITIGEGEGRNWWCVVFPTLCFASSEGELEAIAAGAGFSEGLSGAITGDEGYEVRFFFLDALGRLENILHRE